MPALFSKKLEALQSEVRQIRNICILAHVDHGKTSLADSLVAANGVISARLAGKLRYMDSRKDEQERGITMKTSAIALFYLWQEQEFLINLMDSPGHVDFSSEVCTAVRLCDGAIVVVDIVEGVQPQTKVVLEQAWNQGIRPILVLNKIDRLILEKKLEPTDAYAHISQVLEQVNAVMGELFASSVMLRHSNVSVSEEKGNQQGDLFDWSSGLEEADDSQLYFSPAEGNVVFASATDSWAFSVATFADIYSKKLSCSAAVLKRTLWGDYFINMKEKKILKGASAKGKKPLFVQLVLENIWAVYETVAVSKDKAKLEKIISALGLTVAPRDLKTTDIKQQLVAVMSTWLPVARAVLSMVCEQLPSPADIGSERARRLMCPQTKKFEALPALTRALLSHFEACSAAEGAPKIVFVSKMFAVRGEEMPERRAKPLTEEEMLARREAARRRHEQHKQQLLGVEGALELTQQQLAEVSLAGQQLDPQGTAFAEPELEFIAFARVFSGKLRPGDKLYVLGPKYDPAISGTSLTQGIFPPDCHASLATVTGVYMLLGRELEVLEEAYPGNIVGISGLASHVVKSATLCSEPWCPPFVELVHSTVAILRNAIEPLKSSDLAALSRGLQILNQADAHVEILVSESGETLLLTAGEVHLQRCIRDLEESYAKCPVSVSEPIVPFRETIVPPPQTDMVNEAIEGARDGAADTGLVEIETPNKQCSFAIRAVPLPLEYTKLLEENNGLLKALTTGSDLTQRTVQAIAELRESLSATVNENDSDSSRLQGCVDRLLSFGPKRVGPNVLVNAVAGLQLATAWNPQEKARGGGDGRADLLSSLVNGFQLAALAGPICEEPMMGVAFIIEEWRLREEGEPGWGPLSGQIVSTVKEGCRRAFQLQPQRLMVAMYTCDISVKAEVLGKMYSVINRRRGQVVREEMVEGSSTFTVTAHIPVIESFDLANELRKQTSGLAMPQLVFSHWHILNIDPYWEPKTEEELLHFGEKADSENPARVYMNNVKRRKGLKIDEKIVEFAEKQRTLTKSK